MSLDSFIRDIDKLQTDATKIKNRLLELQTIETTVRNGFFPTAHNDVPPDPNQRQYRINVIYRILAASYNRGEQIPRAKRWIYREVLKMMAQDCKDAKRHFMAPAETTIFRDLNYSADPTWEGFQTDPFYIRYENRKQKIIPATVCQKAGFYRANPALLDTISVSKLAGNQE